MPRDVAIGEGYDGDQMIAQASPGSHVGHYAYDDGSSVLRAQHTGFSVEIPALGRPPRGHRGGGRRWGHGGGWGRGWGGPAYYPYQPEPLYIEVVQDRDVADDEQEKIKKAKIAKKKKYLLLSGLAGPDECACIKRAISVAATAARESIAGITSGVFKSLDEVREHIRRRVCEAVREHLASYGKSVTEAIKAAFSEIKVHAEKALAERKQGGMSGLAGPSQGYYNKLTAAQNKAVAIQAEISGIGEDDWNSIFWSNAAAFAQGGWSPVENYLYSNMMAFWLTQTKRLITTTSKIPPESDINDVMRLAGGTDKMIAMVKSLAPSEVAARATADRKDMEARLAAAGPLKSPTDAGIKSFVSDIQSKLSIGAVGVGTMLAIAAGIYFAFGRGR